MVEGIRRALQLDVRGGRVLPTCTRCVLHFPRGDPEYGLLLGEPKHAAEDLFQQCMVEIRDYLRDMSLKHAFYDCYSVQFLRKLRRCFRRPHVIRRGCKCHR